MIGPGPGYAAWTGTLEVGPVRHGQLATGDRLAVDDVHLTVLWPDPGQVPEHPSDGGTAINNVSIVLLGQVGARRFLLAGDIEQQIDPILLARGLPSVDFLKVAHHGSRTASTAEFLAAVRPRIAVVSAGAGNPYGHPAPATMERLKQVARQTFRTDLDGSVEVQFDGDVVSASATGGRRAAAASAPRATPSLTATLRGAGAAATAVAGPPVFACAISTGATVASPASLFIPEPPPAPAVELATRERLARQPDPERRATPNRPATVWPDRSATRPTEPPIGLLYHRPDDGPFAIGGDFAPPLPRPAGLAPAAFARRRRGRGMAGGSSGACRAAGRSAARRGGRAPPRRRQDPPPE
jgi:competence protein ComEC